jgi:hypothetical protein
VKTKLIKQLREYSNELIELCKALESEDADTLCEEIIFIIDDVDGISTNLHNLYKTMLKEEGLDE